MSHSTFHPNSNPAGFASSPAGRAGAGSPRRLGAILLDGLGLLILIAMFYAAWLVTP